MWLRNDPRQLVMSQKKSERKKGHETGTKLRPMWDKGLGLKASVEKKKSVIACISESRESVEILIFVTLISGAINRCDMKSVK